MDRIRLVESDAVEGVLVLGGLRPGHERKVAEYPDGRCIAVCRCGWTEGFTGPLAVTAASAVAYAHATDAVKIVAPDLRHGS